MSQAYITLLEKRIASLSEADFDLETWKSGTSLLLTRVFGEGNSYSNEINNLKVDYSSWSLRDATSDYNPREACKRSGKDILELAIAELGLLENKDQSLEDIKSILQDKSGKLIDALDKKDEEAVHKLLNKENKDDLSRLLAKLLVK